jgi:hypothetical protein
MPTGISAAKKAHEILSGFFGMNFYSLPTACDKMEFFHAQTNLQSDEFMEWEAYVHDQNFAPSGWASYLIGSSSSDHNKTLNK